jgi:hypothetical protein
MKIKKQTKTAQILMVMRILAWVAFIGFMIEAGAIMISYGISCVNPEASMDLYKGLNLYNLREFNFWHYTLSVSLLIVLSIIKSFTWFLVIKTLSKINLINPFNKEVSQKIERVSYFLFGTWLVGMLMNIHIGMLLKLTGEVQGNWFNGEIIFMAGLVFIISQIFKRGVEIQSENELTV